MGPERHTVGECKETTEVTSRGIDDRGRGDEFAHGQRGAVPVRERGLVRGVTDLEQLELVEVFRLERLVAYFKRSEEHTSELQSHSDLVCRLLLEKKKKK